MMGSAPLVFDISSDEEPVVEAIKCGDDDHTWLKEILDAVSKKTDGSDEIFVLGEYDPKSQSKSQTVANMEDDDDDDDCIVLNGDPDKVSCAGEEVNQCDGDSDEVMVVGQKGQIKPMEMTGFVYSRCDGFITSHRWEKLVS